jgi:hypothetical protein
MKKYVLKTIALVSITGAAMLAHGGPAADGNITASQPDFPKIILQPEDQMACFGSNTVFTVTSANTDGYQWLRNGNPLDGQTNTTLVIANCSIKNVGYYACNLFKGMETVPTRSASLMVYTNSIDPVTQVDPVTVYAFPVSGSGGTGTCPGHYVGYVNYAKSSTNGWGWAPDTTNGNTTFTATDTNRPDTKVQYFGAFGDNGCNQTGVTVPSPAISPVYRFTIYFTNNVPTNAYAITLNGFKP